MQTKRAGIFLWFLLALIGADFIYLNFIWRAPAGEYRTFFGEKAVLYARVVADPIKRGNDMRLVLSPDSSNYREKILATVRQRNEFKYGDEVLLIGKLKEPQNTPDFDYRDYLLAQDISAQSYYPEVYILSRPPPQGIRDAIFLVALQIKHFLFAGISAHLPGQPGALLIALLSGDKEYLSKDVESSFNNIGAAHMIAVSGYKLTLIFVYLEALRPYLGKRLTYFCCITAGLLYACAAGFAPAVLRVVIMSSIYILAREHGRKYQQLRALIFTAALLILIDPLVIKFDLGFILSFSGILGIILLSPIIEIFLKKIHLNIPKLFGLREILISTTAAEIVTIPIMVYFFHSLPLIAPLANLFLVPLLAPLVLPGWFSVMPITGTVFSKILLAPLNYLLAVSAYFNSLKYSSIPAALNLTVFILVYLAEAGLYFLAIWRLRRLKQARESAKINSPKTYE